MREHCNNTGRSGTSNGVHALAFFLSREIRGVTEKAEILEGKIKARSRKRSQVVVCTSFFSETYFCMSEKCETFGTEATLFCGFRQSLVGFALLKASLP
jgi:hypothetical protein